MTIRELTDILRESGADAWEITDTRTEGWEFYFIRHALDQNRVRDVEHMEIAVYRAMDDGGMLGRASAEIPPTATAEEARKEIAGLLKDAEYAKNPAYRLNVPAPFDEPQTQEADPAAIAREYLETMQGIPETDGEDLNSYEIFVDRQTVRYCNSEGIDVTQTYPSSTVEVVVNARDGGQEIELYRLFQAGTCDRKMLSEDIGELMRFGRDRLAARPTPAIGTGAVLFPTKDAVELYRYFADRMNAKLVYMKMSDWKIGTAYASEAKGDQVTLTARAFLPNSSRNRVFDEEGAPVRDLPIITNGIPEHYWGKRQFRYYLDEEAGFDVGNFEVSGGTGTEESLRRGSYLEVVEFSDFSVDELTGDLAGEIRLAYWHDGDREIPVTGGSVSGTLRELVNDMRFSAAQRQYDNYLIPRLTRLEGVNITGIEED